MGKGQPAQIVNKQEAGKQQILIVDDEEYVRNLIGEILEMEGYPCSLAGNAAEARESLKKNKYALIICDISMPGESGMDFIRYALAEHQDTAAIMVTAMDDPLVAESALRIGVYDYIIKPFDVNGVIISVANALRRRQLEIDNRAYRLKLERMVSERTATLHDREARLRAIFEAAEHVSFIMTDSTKSQTPILEFSPGAERLLGYSRREVIGRPATMINLPDELTGVVQETDPDEEDSTSITPVVYLYRKSGQKVPVFCTTYPIFNSEGDMTATLVVAIDISERIKAEKKLENSMKDLRKALEGTVLAVAKTLETRDPYTAGHEQRVANLATAIGQHLGLSESRMDGLRMAALIHDLGKISVPAGILNKPGNIGEIELDLIKRHPKVGYDILKDIEFPWPIAQMVLQHHERMDGTGYPMGLSGRKILLESRILGVADVVEAMATHRPYRPAVGIDKALAHIRDKKGSLYDARVVIACLKLFEEEGFTFD